MKAAVVCNEAYDFKTTINFVHPQPLGYIIYMHHKVLCSNALPRLLIQVQKFPAEFYEVIFS